ncbi:chemotaxis protein [Clostridium beijerinckii]|uniref:chemotaxis protein n=1 Tax=Clostridium beijerinckii TaxID=1520 RepID=UPI0013611848|nr:chemotaxis protein [Clostridium beijerinckii]MZK49877.1 chemotaxis protein [Clostridium beijerinckii]MZK57836.1 chemotaxis protein [Clostridium beijerinckii]MZK68047.1 chemotaxis protein [Clostridium beijerinckii]MZK73545.1 chemotaxis protein [Clostridium beijerinckii]MZK83127.1 chemotaxis protein [Clostridium beijerinckii]
MIKIIIFGTGSTSFKVISMLNKNTKIIAFADNDKSKCGKKINDVEIIYPSNILEYTFDYIIIASQFNEDIYSQLIKLKVDKNKIIQFYKILDEINSYVENKINSFKKEDYSNTELIITGISYCNLGFREDICLKNAYKFAFASQDIFYDYKIMKYVIENGFYNINKFKYVIIGLCYYSFQYDMSLSSMKNKVMLYYKFLKTAHNFKNYNNNFIENDYELNKLLFSKVFQNEKKVDSYCDVRLDSLIDIENKYMIGKKQAFLDCNKNYPETVRENKQIFKNYLHLLEDYNIKPIVVIFPASKHYTKYFSKRIEDEFHSIIKEVRQEHDFQYIDYFRSDLFNDDDFQDVSHLNSKGAEKFTKILNEAIEW